MGKIHSVYNVYAFLSNELSLTLPSNKEKVPLKNNS